MIEFSFFLPPITLKNEFIRVILKFFSTTINQPFEDSQNLLFGTLTYNSSSLSSTTLYTFHILFLPVGINLRAVEEKDDNLTS